MKAMEQPSIDQNENDDYQHYNLKYHSPTNYSGNELTMPLIPNNFFSPVFFSFLFIF